MLLVAHINVVNPLSREVEILRVTTGRRYTFNGHDYIPCMTKGINYQQSLFSKGTTSGSTSVGTGELELVNNGLFNYLKSYGFDGQTVEMYVLDNRSEALSSSNIYFKNTIVHCEIEIDKLVIKFNDKLQDLDVPCTEATFLGTNSGPTGLEGTEETIKGNQKPMLYGRCFNIPLFALNVPKLIYGCNFDKEGDRKAIAQIWNVRDKGGEIKWEGDVATSTALIAATVTDGFYKSCIAEGLIKPGSIPIGDFTADIYEAEGAENCSAGRVVRRMLEDLKDYAAGIDFNPGDLNYLDEFNACPVGIYITSDLSILSAITQLLDSIGAWMVPEPLGILRFGILQDPNDLEYIEEITDNHYLEGSLNRVATNDDSKNIPAFKVELKHTKNWQPLPKTSVLESVDLEIKEMLKLEYRSSVAEDQDVKLVHPLAPYLTFETLLMGARPAKTRKGEMDLLQVSGTGGSATFSDGQVTIVPGTGTYSATHVLTSPDEIYPGDFIVSFNLISGTVYLGGTLFDTVGVNSLEYTTTGTHNLVFDARTATGTCVIDDIKVYEVNAGLTPDEEAARRLDIQKKSQERYTLELDFTAFRHLQVGQVIKLESKNFLIIGRDDDLSDEKIELDTWTVNAY